MHTCRNLINICNIDKNHQKLTFANDHGSTRMDDSSLSATNFPCRRSVEARSDEVQIKLLARRLLVQVWWRVGELAIHGEVEGKQRLAEAGVLRRERVLSMV